MLSLPNISDPVLKHLRLTYVFLSVLLAGCSATKYVPDKEYLLDKVELKSDTKGFDAALLAPYIHQKGNSRWFSLFRIPLGAYSLSGLDSTKWVNRTLRKVGEAPVVFDTLEAARSLDDLTTAMRNMGYMNARATLATTTKGKRLKAVYTLHPGEPFRIARYTLDIQDTAIARVLAPHARSLQGQRLAVGTLDDERNRLTAILLDSGYYRFHKDFIQFSADTAHGSRDVNVTLHLAKYRANSSSPLLPHPRYRIGSVSFLAGDGGRIHLRPHVLERGTAIEEGQWYSSHSLQKTYNNFARLGAVRYTNITFRERPDTALLDCDVQISTNKPNTVSFQPEGTNTAGDLGAAASLTWQNRNVFRGSELLSIELRAAFEAITGLEGYQNQDYEEYSIESKLSFPRFVAPFLSQSFRRRSSATSELSVSWDLQNRPEFHRRVFSTAWRYRWQEPRHHLSWRLDVLDLNYVYMPWISETFKHDYLDSVSNRNAILRYNYEDLFIMKIGLGISYNDGTDALRANVETAGNLLHGLAHTLGFKRNDQGQYRFLNIAFAQYAKLDFDYTHLFTFDSRNTLALHAAVGVAWPYGNSTILPFEKRYFSGGPNSVRGWAVRELGPGSFRSTDGRTSFINQTGDMKLDLNLEYRTSLFWKLGGAVFVDAGNIWTLRRYAEQPGGQFRLGEFYKQIAMAYGIGLRLNFDYFVLRFDMGMKAVDPACPHGRDHYPIFHPDLGRDFTFHFAVGLPF